MIPDPRRLDASNRPARAARLAFFLLGLSVAAAGCGEGAAPASPSAHAAAPWPSPAPAPQAARAPENELRPLRLSLLQARLPAGCVFYFRDPKQDPGGKLGENPHPLRDIYRPLGAYEMRFSRRGYRNVDVALRLTPQGPDPALESLEIRFEPAEELAGSYREAEAALNAGDARRAREALERVRALDEGFRETAALLDRLKAMEEGLERAREALRRGDLDAAGRVEALRPEVEEVRRERARFEEAVGRFDAAAAEEALDRLRQALTPADPSHRDRAGRIEDLKAARSLLQGYEEICVDPSGPRERLAALFDREAAGQAAALALSMERFSRHARFLSVRHEPVSWARRDDIAELRARLKVRYSLAAGETALEETVVVRLRKTDAWRMTDYGKAP